MAAETTVATVQSFSEDTADSFFAPLVAPRYRADNLIVEHSPFVAGFLQTNTAPLNLLDYFHRHGPNLVEFLTAGFTHRQLYNLLTKEVPHPVPVGYPFFTRTLATFRQQKGLPPSQVCRPRKSVPPGAATMLPCQSMPSSAAPALLAIPSAPPALLPTPQLLTPPTPPRVPAAAPGTFFGESDEAYEARMAALFPRFTAEDARQGKPVAELRLEKERADLAEYERTLWGDGPH